ncbi:MAG: hypothetical protein ABI203_09035 [Mucilaginibacter sp.]
MAVYFLVNTMLDLCGVFNLGVAPIAIGARLSTHTPAGFRRWAGIRCYP